MRRSAVLVTIAVVVSLLSSACGDGSSKEQPPAPELPPLSAEQAKLLIDRSLLRVEDLPPGTWVLDSEQWTDEHDFFAVTPECAGGAIFRQDLIAPDRFTAHAARTLSAEINYKYLEVIYAVASGVVVFPTPQAASDVQQQLARALTAKAFQSCAEAAFARLFVGNPDVRIERVDLSNPSIRATSGTALRAEARLRALGRTHILTMEFHAFQRGSVLAVLVTTEMNSRLLRDSRPAVINRFEKKVADALSAYSGRSGS